MEYAIFQMSQYTKINWRLRAERLLFNKYYGYTKTLFYWFSLKIEFDAKTGGMVHQDITVHITLSMGRIDMWLVPKLYTVASKIIPK